MSNCIFAYPDRILGATLSSGSWNASYPLNNLKDPLFAKKARSSNAQLTSTKFDVDFGVERQVRVISIIGHNSSAVAKIRVRLYAGAGHTNLQYDTGWVDVYSAFWPHGLLEWEDPAFWGGELTPEDIASYHPDCWLVITPSAARYMLVEIDDTTNSAGYVELARCFAAPGWQSGVNISHGAGIAYNTDTQVQRTLGGVDYFDIRTGRRAITGSFDALTIEEGMSKFESQRRLGIHGEMYFIFEPDDTILLYKQRAMLCRYKQLDQIEFPYFDGASFAFTLEEIL